jgi:hypothetical protein
MVSLPSKSDAVKNESPEAWLGRGAHRLKPAADVYLGVGFATIMPGSRGVGYLGVPPVHRKAGVSAMNDEPVDGITGHDATDFASEFLYRCHAPTPVLIRLS